MDQLHLRSWMELLGAFPKRNDGCDGRWWLNLELMYFKNTSIERVQNIMFLGLNVMKISLGNSA